MVYVKNGHFQRDNTTHVAWATAVAKETESTFVDLYEIINPAGTGVIVGLTLYLEFLQR